MSKSNGKHLRMLNRADDMMRCVPYTLYRVCRVVGGCPEEKQSGCLIYMFSNGRRISGQSHGSITEEGGKESSCLAHTHKDGPQDP